jgi:hypothetical protein
MLKAVPKQGNLRRVSRQTTLWAIVSEPLARGRLAKEDRFDGGPLQSRSIRCN